MGEVGVHLQDQAGARREGVPETGDVGRAQPFLPRAVQDLEALIALGQPLGDRAGPVRGVVVDDQDPPRPRQLRQRRLDDPLDVGRLVVGRQHEPRRCGHFADAIRRRELRLGRMERSLGLDPHREVGRSLSVPALIAEQIAAQPDTIAIEDGERTVTYAELDLASGAIAATLIDAGIEAEELVAVNIPRSWQAVCALLGVQRAGGAYVPLDPAHPPQRRQALIELSGARTTLGPTEVEWAIASEAAGPEPPEGGARLAYVLFTSGSTGTPKGVSITHGGLVHLLRSEWELFPEPGEGVPPRRPARLRPLRFRDLGDPRARGPDRRRSPRAAGPEGHRRADRRARGRCRDALARDARPSSSVAPCPSSAGCGSCRPVATSFPPRPPPSCAPPIPK